MGRLIHTNDLHNVVMNNKSNWGVWATTIDNFIESLIMQTPTVEAIPKADYEARLKADKLAMLEGLKLDMGELPLDLDSQEWIEIAIDKRINSLKGGTG